MSSGRHDRISEIFLKACELEPEERGKFLDEACHGDAVLRREVESLLDHDEQELLKTGGGIARAASMLEHRRCPDCGAEIPLDSNDCPSCRTRTAMPSDQSMSIPGYTILRLLGEGGMGKVYLAEDDTLGRRVAIKLVSGPQSANEAAAQRFLREARTMARVEHPNIVRLYSFGEVDNRHYLVMQYVEGESLAARMRRLGKLPVDEALQILSQTAGALKAAWEHGIFHRDVKPANILLDEQERVHVVDFGLAKATEVKGDPSITVAGQLLGTPRYLSPEQARGEEDLDFRTDIYSLGIVLYEMLTGEPPFHGATPISIVDQHIHTPLPPMRMRRPDVPDEIEQLCEWMTRKRPADRPGSYDELGQSIDVLLGKASSMAPAVAAMPSFIAGAEEEEEEARLFVGREGELERLQRSLDRALAGEGQVVFVTGEAGSGKTALIGEFARKAQESHPELIVAEGNCEAQTGAGDPYLPFRDILGLLTGDVEYRRASRAITVEHARRLWSLLPLAAEALVDSGPDLLGAFISGEALVSRAAAFTPSPARWRVRLEELVRVSAARPRDAGLQQSYLFEQYARMLQALAQKQPLLLQLEDLHWADGGSCGLLFHLGRRIAGGRIMIVGTYRPAEVELEREGQRHPMRPVINEFQRQFGDLELHVGEEETREFIDELLDAEPNNLTAEFRDRLYGQTRGHPLFTVELIGSMREQRMLVQDDAGRWTEGPAMDWETLPARVEGAIGERIDRLPEEQYKTLMLASVQGEEFIAEVVAQVQGSRTREIVGLLSGELDKRHRLVAPQGIRRMNGQRISTYRFRHNLFQKYLYDQMDEMERAYTHEDVGTALEGLFASRTEEVAVQLARHFGEAGMTSKAIDYLLQAGERATRLLANEEAIEHLRRALGLLDSLPDDEERARRELALQLALGPPIFCTAGPGSDELSEAYFRARELCDRVGTAPQLFLTLFLLIHHHANKDQYLTALETAEQLLEVAQNSAEDLPVVLAHWARGFLLHCLGKLSECLESHERVISLYDREKHAHLAHIFGMDVAVSSLAYIGVTQWMLGYPDRAREYSKRALALARDLNHPNSLAHGLTQACQLAFLLRDTEALERQVEELIRISTEHGVKLFLSAGLVFQVYAVSWRGRHEEAIELSKKAVAAFAASGSTMGSPGAFAFNAEVCARAGHPEEGLPLISEALSIARNGEEGICLSEVHRIWGEFLLWQDPESKVEAEAAFRQALEVARVQGARSLELRAVMPLSRLLHSLGRRDEAHELLASVYEWFTEGLDTPDLKDAAELLKEQT